MVYVRVLIFSFEERFLVVLPVVAVQYLFESTLSNGHSRRPTLYREYRKSIQKPSYFQGLKLAS